MGGLSQQDYLDAVAYLLSQGGIKSGNTTFSYAGNDWQDQIISLPTEDTNNQGIDKDWAGYRGSMGGDAYAELPGLTIEKFKELKIAWRWDTSNIGPNPELRNSNTPIVIDGIMYVTTGLTRNVAALNAETGQLLWLWRSPEGERFEAAPRKGSGRGVAYWQSGDDQRIFSVTPGFQLVALNAKNGVPIEGFGNQGIVDLMEGLRLPPDGSRDIGNSSPPLVVGDVVIVGPAHAVGMVPERLNNVKGDVRAYDTRTGKRVWTFHTIPAKGEPGYETWENNSAETTGNAGVWAPMSADGELGLVYLPVETSTHDLYGGHRPGANLYATSLVAVHAKTGKLAWAQQLIHHDIWDWDTTAIPILMDIPTSDGIFKAVVQLTKQSFVFVFNRQTGEPLWPIEELPVPPSDMPGEQAWPTQPHPTKPAPFDRQGVTEDDFTDFTPKILSLVKEEVKNYRLGRLFTPPSLIDHPDGTVGTLTLPGAVGGANWEGGAVDPQNGVIFVPSITLPFLFSLKSTGHDKVPYVAGDRARLTVGGNIPIIKPPWGRITAIDLKTGEHLWMSANAEARQEILENPLLDGLDLPLLGKPNRSGLLATKHLLIAGEGWTGDPILRAFNKQTGKIEAQIALPGTQSGLPMAFVINGKEYIAMTVGDGENAAELIVLSYE
jgi:quinoprotein glucose dehydrogenase